MPVGTKNTVIAGCGTHHIAIQTRDWEASVKLYRDVLGMTAVAEWQPGGRAGMLLDMGDGSHMEIFAPTTNTPAPGEQPGNAPIVHFALATTDARAALEHVRQAGYEVTVEPKDVELGPVKATIAFFRGPNGESIEFFQTH